MSQIIKWFFLDIQMYHFSIFKIWQIGLLPLYAFQHFSRYGKQAYYIFSALQNSSSTFSALILLLPYYIIFYYYYYYLLPLYIISAGVLRFYKNADPLKTFLFFFIVPPHSLKFPPGPVDASALIALHRVNFFYPSFPCHFFQFCVKC